MKSGENTRNQDVSEGNSCSSTWNVVNFNEFTWKKYSRIFAIKIQYNNLTTKDDTLRTRRTEKIVSERSQTQISKTETPNQRNSSFWRNSISLASQLAPAVLPPQIIFTLSHLKTLCTMCPIVFDPHIFKSSLHQDLKWKHSQSLSTVVMAGYKESYIFIWINILYRSIHSILTY